MSLMAAAAHQDLPIASITAIAAPFDTSEVKLVAAAAAAGRAHRRRRR